MLRRLVLAMCLPLAFWSCADEPAPQEPVGADGKPAPEAPPAVPDMPGGDNATTAERPAGEGSAQAAGDANAAAATPAPATTEAAPAPAAAPATGGQMTVTASGLNVRSGPGTKHASLRVLKKGTTVNVVGCEGIWCRIGEGEYVSKKHLSGPH